MVPATSRNTTLLAHESNKRHREADDKATQNNTTRIRVFDEWQTQNREFGFIITARLQQLHGAKVRPDYEYQRPRLKNTIRPIAPDILDAIFLADRGFFLCSSWGIRYYIWRCSALDRTRKRYPDRNISPDVNIFNNIPSFCLSLPPNASIELCTSTYTYIYRCWYQTIFYASNEREMSKNWNAFLDIYLKSQGIKDMDSCWKRICYFMNRAYQIWGTKRRFDETLAFLRSSEELWFKEDYMVDQADCILHVADDNNPDWRKAFPQYFPQTGGKKGRVKDSKRDHFDRAITLGVAKPATTAQEAKESDDSSGDDFDGDLKATDDDQAFMDELFDFDEASGNKRHKICGLIPDNTASPMDSGETETPTTTSLWEDGLLLFEE